MDRLSNGEADQMRYRVDPRTDYQRWIEVRGRPIVEDGEVRRVVGYSREVTERMRQERELRRTRRLLSESLDALDEVFCILDADGRIQRCNDTLAEVVGEDPAAVEGTHAPAFFAETDRQLVEAAIEEAVETGTARGEARMVTAEGEQVPYEFTGARLDDDDGTLRGVIAIGRDVSERVEYERTLEAQNERLEEFAGFVSHDLRNPLTAIHSQLELYRATGDESHLDDIETTLGRMERLLEDLLQVARYGEAVEDPTPTDLDTVVDRAAVGALPGSTTLEVESVPTLYADADRLQQLIENLLRNAAEHGATRDGSAGDGADDASDADGLRVRVGPVTADDSPEGFYVADDGPGIPESDRARVFETGYTTSDDGTGYGLSVVRSVAEAHGWTVSVEESWAGGARVELRNVSFADAAATVDADLDA